MVRHRRYRDNRYKSSGKEIVKIIYIGSIFSFQYSRLQLRYCSKSVRCHLKSVKRCFENLCNIGSLEQKFNSKPYRSTFTFADIKKSKFYKYTHWKHSQCDMIFDKPVHLKKKKL